MTDRSPRTYAYNTLYTEAEIAQRNNVRLFCAEDGDEYLVTDYCADGLQYWFSQFYDLWLVDHTWGCFILGRKGGQ